MKKLGRIRVEEAAKRAFVSGETIRYWCREGKVQAIQFGHKWWVDEASLNGLLQVGILRG